MSLPGLLCPRPEAQKTSEWFNEHDDDTNHMLLLSQSSHLASVEYLWVNLSWHVRHSFLPSSSKLLMRNIFTSDSDEDCA